MKHVWSIICEKSSIDFENNFLSLFNCVEELSVVLDRTKVVDDRIVIPVNFQIVSFWLLKNIGKEKNIKIKGEFIDPQGIILNTFQNELKVTKGIKRFRNRINIQGLPISEKGRYFFNIWQKIDNKFEIVAELPLDIDLSYKIN